MATRPVLIPEPDPYELISELINAVLDNGDFVPAVEARSIDNLMRSKHRAAHDAFLSAESYHLYYEALTKANENRRQRARSHAPANDFARRAAGNPNDLSVFLAWRMRVADDNTQRAVGDMVGADHIYVADHYCESKQESAMLEAFHRACAKKVGERKTSEVMSEEEFLKLYESITH